MELSLLQKKRLSYEPVIPRVLSDLRQVRLVPFESEKRPLSKILSLFPHIAKNSPYRLEKGEGSFERKMKIGVLFSGGQAAGGHNVLIGLFEALEPGSHLIGFLDGPSGLLKNQFIELTKEILAPYRNQGGFDLLGSGRTKIETPEQFAQALKTVNAHHLDGLVIIGGDDSNTNAALLAEQFLADKCKTSVIGVPKTIDGDLRSEKIEISFGFDSACKTYSEAIGNIGKDVLSAKKYYHFIKLMGRSASHIALECALSTRPNLVLIGEEVAEKKLTLKDLTDEICDLICKRKEAGKEYGLIVLPEGLIEFIPEMKELMRTTNPLEVPFFQDLPDPIQKQLLLERDPHGNVQVSQIETESLLIELVKRELKKRKFTGKFSPVAHFFGYEGRACTPSNFDANYTYALGRLAALGLREKITGGICSIQHLRQPPEKWTCEIVPILTLMDMELRHGTDKPVIRKALVDLKGKPFAEFARARASWRIEDHYLSPGPIQFFGDPDLTDAPPRTMK